ncbi:putative non-specific serine/threonine protein kinase [Rosa chinensis]|uniref:Putative non-specific serine/threonine protein kinase n=1 Tax=Rosa chinensis TaxID=74649 RepID=A0A2P6SD01_ROSCH|nr:putative non-specific serine/threonine protein kinase [Rosa chinensis]
MAQGFILILILFSSILSPQVHGCSKTESASLLSFVVTLSSPSLNWTSNNCCYWEGITCNLDGLVTHLRLPSKGLKNHGDSFSLSFLKNLTHLAHLNLSHNSLYGSVDQIGSLFLEVIDLSNNLLSGELPHVLPSTSIKVVDLSHNHFTGPISSSFFRQSRNLTSFRVSNNAFSGSLPSSICRRSSSMISLLDFSFNEFNGSLSSGFGQCSKLEVFRAGHNNLSGMIPEDFYNATTLEEIALPLCSLYGVISDRVANLTNLSILNLYFNQLSGVLPFHFGKLSKLKLLLLHFNSLEGTVPPSLMNCTSLTELNLGFNRLEGDISTLNFSKLGQLSKLDLANNHFTGPFPMSLYSCKSLKGIRLSRNDLDGQIQPQILSLKSLSFLSLANIRLTNITKAMNILKHSKRLTFLSLGFSFLDEESPADFGMANFSGFQNLRFLDMANCGLTGQIPVWLSNLKKLGYLNLNFNMITGSIPSWLGTLPSLFHLQLYSNLIMGQFPEELCRLPMLTLNQTIAKFDDDGYLTFPLYDGETGNQLNSLRYLPRAIDLGRNNLSGIIPNEIGQLQLLRDLYLTSNDFSGNIPGQISHLKNLEILDLSMNRLSGEIPGSLASLNFLSYFNVSYNNLEGPIPKSTQLQSLSATAFEGNLELIVK